MATTTYNDDVIIDGMQDEVQLTVQGHSTQTEPLQEWQDSGGAVLAEVTEDGYFHTGDMTVSTEEALIEAHRGESSSLATRGINTLGKIASTLTTAVAWLVSELQLVGTATISSLHTAMRGRVTHSSTGDSSNAELRGGDFETINQSGSSSTPVGRAVGVQGTVDNQSNAYLTDASAVVAQVQNATGADIETATALEVATPVNNGTIDTLIGLDVPDINQGTDNYAIRTAEGVVQLGDVVEMIEQSTDPANKSGVMQFYAKSGKPFAKAPDPDNTVYDLTQGSGSASVMTGATDTTDGASGLVPQPVASDDTKFLKGDGTWANTSVVDALDDLSDVNLGTPANGDVLSFNGTDWEASAPSGGGGSGLYTSIAILRDEKAAATGGGTASYNSWNHRDLNTILSDPDSIVSLANNEFIPASGVYELEAYAPAFRTNRNRLRLYNVTNSLSVEEGQNNYSGSAAGTGVGSTPNAQLRCIFTANGTDAYRIDHYTQTGGTSGQLLGVYMDHGSPEVYLVMILRKLS